MLKLLKKYKKYILLGFILIIAIIAVLSYKNVKEPVVTVEQRQDINVEMVNKAVTEEPDVIKKQGEFLGADKFHYGRGQAVIIQTKTGPVLKFENFEVRQGPDLFVYLSPNEKGEDFGAFVSLGNLQTTGGDQVYTLPSNYNDYKTVIIWCRAFSTTFATAELE